VSLPARYKRESEGTVNTQQLFSTSSLPIVVDVWPNSLAFGNADVWEAPALTQTEGDQLDQLVGLALLDSSVADRLVVQRDPALLDTFNLTNDTRQWLSELRVGSLEELAQAILVASNPHRISAVSKAA